MKLPHIISHNSTDESIQNSVILLLTYWVFSKSFLGTIALIPVQLFLPFLPCSLSHNLLETLIHNPLIVHHLSKFFFLKSRDRKKSNHVVCEIHNLVIAHKCTFFQLCFEHVISHANVSKYWSKCCHYSNQNRKSIGWIWINIQIKMT